jgi:hypothetical protein
MKTENEINTEILKITMTIRENYPELSKFLGEMPVTIPDENNPHINIKILDDYNESLQSLLREYLVNHNEIM